VTAGSGFEPTGLSGDLKDIASGLSGDYRKFEAESFASPDDPVLTK
jgi:hypothetical protein